MVKNWPEPYEDHSALDETYFSASELQTFENLTRHEYCLEDSEADHRAQELSS